MSRLYAVEGVDGSGKSTIARTLADYIDASYYYGVPENLKEEKKIADAGSLEGRYNFYVKSNNLAQAELRELLKQKDVVSDWYAYSTAAFHSVLLGRKIELQPDIMVPDKTIYVRADWDVIEDRIIKKSHVNERTKIPFLKEVDKRFLEMFGGLDNVIYVDNSHAEINSLVKQIASQF